MSSAGSPNTKDTPSLDHVEKNVAEYKLYKRRFSGLLGFIILGLVAGMQWSWFGPIATKTADEFNISLAQVNWLGNISLCVSLPAAFLVPLTVSRFGIRRCSEIGGVMLFISAWLRYAGTIPSLSPRSAYILLFFGQFFGALSKPISQILGPMFSERWFDLRNRTTATMAIAISGSIGSALGQLLSPLMSTVRQSILVLSVISTAALPAIPLILESPPSPPSTSGTLTRALSDLLSLASMCRAMLGLPVSKEAHMSLRERIDFVILTLVFGGLDGAISVLSVLSAQWFEPVGYSAATCGRLGATLLLSGITAAVVSAPLFDRVFTHSMGATLRTLVPIVSLMWLSLIWAVTPNNAAVLFVLMAMIGSCSISMLPLALELGVELTRNANGSSAVLLCSGNLCAIVLILVEGALRAPSDLLVFSSCIVFLRAKQARREADEVMIKDMVLGTFPDAVSAGGIGQPSNTGVPLLDTDQATNLVEMK
ncbi:major facilitator superfamily domain-containing protein [Pisolithus sp. B1]|nr:major facilitator superfamily domain-containing protein [Pisolithus sp. B1]